jgi:hypothetical protein
MSKMKSLCCLGILALALAACAGLNLSLIGKNVSVRVPTEIPFPDTLTLVLDPQNQQLLGLGDRALGLVGGGSVEQRLGQLLKDQTLLLRKEGAASFRDELEKSGLFGSVVTQGGTVGFSVGVSRFGLAYDGPSRSYHLVLELEAQLSEPHLGVVWKGHRSVEDLSPAAKAEAHQVNLAGVMAQPESLHRFNHWVVGELSRQLVDDLRKNPPTGRPQGSAPAAAPSNGNGSGPEGGLGGLGKLKF